MRKSVIKKKKFTMELAAMKHAAFPLISLKMLLKLLEMHSSVNF